MVAIPRDVNNGRAIVAHDLDVIPPDAPGVGLALAAAVATDDWTALERLLHDEVDFRGLTRRRAWLAMGPEQVTKVLREWATEEGRPGRLERAEVVAIADGHCVCYRMTTGADAECEHTAYFDLDDHARITFVRMLSSGARSAPPS